MCSRQLALQSKLGWLGRMLVQRLSHYAVLRNFKNRRGTGVLQFHAYTHKDPKNFCWFLKGVGRGLMDLDPHWCGRRPSGPRLPAAEPPGSAGSTCACHSNGLPKPPVFFRPPDRRNIGVAHLAAAIASSERRQPTTLTMLSAEGSCSLHPMVSPMTIGR